MYTTSTVWKALNSMEIFMEIEQPLSTPAPGGKRVKATMAPLDYYPVGET